MKRVLIIIIISVFPLMSQLMAQGITKSIDGEIGLIGGKYYSKPFYYISLSRSWWFNKFSGVSAGVLLGHGRIDESWSHGDKFYYINEPTAKLVSVSSIFLAQKILKNAGICTDIQLLFEPIPFSYVPLTVNSNGMNDYKGKYLYSGFNPGYRINSGVFIDENKKEHKYRYIFSIGYGWYDTFNDYRRAVIDNQRIVEHIPVNKPIISISLRIVQFKH